MKKGITGMLFVSAFFLTAVVFSLTALAHKPGAFFFGESDGDGIISGNDYATLVSVIQNPQQSDTTLYSTVPQSRLVQDLDGSGGADCFDLAIWTYWFIGDWITALGIPTALGADPLDPEIVDGGSIWLPSVMVFSSGQKRVGWGVVYKITQNGTCTDADLYGRLASDGDSISWGNTVFAYTMTDGEADVKLRVNDGCDVDDTVDIQVYIPGDSEFLVPGHRFPNALDMGDHFVVTVVAQ